MDQKQKLSRWSEWCNKREGFFLNPAFATVLNLLIIITGLLGALYSDEIRRAFPFHILHLTNKICWEAVVFWGLAAIASAAFYGRESAVDSKSRRATSDLANKANELVTLIRTLPPQDFLSEFQRLYQQGEKVMAVGEKSEIGGLEECVRLVLKIVAVLAQKFDGNQPSVVYAANLMIFYPSSTLDSEVAEKLRKDLVFCDEATDVKKLQGVLHLRKEFSTTANDQNAGPDETLKPFALAIPTTSKVGARYKVLPGAPLAFVSSQTQLQADTSKIREWCDAYGDFDKATIGALEQHFQNVPVKSFISIPLFPVTIRQGNNEPVAVLNIHSSAIGLLRGGETGESAIPLAHFTLITAPFQAMLVKLIDRIQDLELATVVREENVETWSI